MFATGSVTLVVVTLLPELQIVTAETLASSVRLKDSVTVPFTRTLSPAPTGKLVSKTKIPSDVDGSASASASSSCTKKPPNWPASLVVADHNALYFHIRRSIQWTGCTATLDGVNKSSRVAANQYHRSGKAEDKVCCHLVRRIIGILVTHLARQDCHGDSFVIRKIDGGIKGEGRWAAAHGSSMGAT